MILVSAAHDFLACFPVAQVDIILCLFCCFPFSQWSKTSFCIFCFLPFSLWSKTSFCLFCCSPFSQWSKKSYLFSCSPFSRRSNRVVTESRASYSFDKNIFYSCFVSTPVRMPHTCVVSSALGPWTAAAALVFAVSVACSALLVLSNNPVRASHHLPLHCHSSPSPTSLSWKDW